MGGPGMGWRGGHRSEHSFRAQRSKRRQLFGGTMPMPPDFSRHPVGERPLATSSTQAPGVLGI